LLRSFLLIEALCALLCPGARVAFLTQLGSLCSRSTLTRAIPTLAPAFGPVLESVLTGSATVVGVCTLVGLVLSALTALSALALGGLILIGLPVSLAPEGFACRAFVLGVLHRFVLRGLVVECLAKAYRSKHRQGCGGEQLKCSWVDGASHRGVLSSVRSDTRELPRLRFARFKLISLVAGLRLCDISRTRLEETHCR